MSKKKDLIWKMFCSIMKLKLVMVLGQHQWQRWPETEWIRRKQELLCFSKIADPSLFLWASCKCNLLFDLYLLSPGLRKSHTGWLLQNERHSDLVDQAPCGFQCCPLYWRQATPGERRNRQEKRSWQTTGGFRAMVNRHTNSSSSKMLGEVGRWWRKDRVYKNIVMQYTV